MQAHPARAQQARDVCHVVNHAVGVAGGGGNHDGRVACEGARHCGESGEVVSRVRGMGGGRVDQAEWGGETYLVHPKPYPTKYTPNPTIHPKPNPPKWTLHLNGPNPTN